MAQYAHKIKKVTISGTCFGGAEIWTTSFNIGSVSADVSNPTQTFCDAIRTAWTTFFSGTTPQFNSSWLTSNVKMAQIGTDGKTNLDNVIYSPYGTPIAGNSGIAIMPPQVTLAATLAVSGARGLAAKGRMYLPGLAYAVQTDGRITNANATTIATGLQTFINAVNAAAPTGEKVILASQGRRTKGSDGKYTPVPGTAVNAVVNQVRVGNVYDTQRRRRNGLFETYQTAAIS